jgi:hypothetical protein
MNQSDTGECITVSESDHSVHLGLRIRFFLREPSRCVCSTIHYISAVVTQHIKSVALLQLVTFGYMFQPLSGHHQANKE